MIRIGARATRIGLDCLDFSDFSNSDCLDYEDCSDFIYMVYLDNA